MCPVHEPDTHATGYWITAREPDDVNELLDPATSTRRVEGETAGVPNLTPTAEYLRNCSALAAPCGVIPAEKYRTLSCCRLLARVVRFGCLKVVPRTSFHTSTIDQLMLILTRSCERTCSHGCLNPDRSLAGRARVGPAYDQPILHPCSTRGCPRKCCLRRHAMMASDSPRDHSISAGAAAQIAGAFKLRVADVFVDADELSMWSESGDDLMQLLERRHAFRASAALAYLISLRVALSGRRQ